MNKQKKRAISRGKFERCSCRAVRGMRVNAFDDYDRDTLTNHLCYVTDGFIYWQTFQFLDCKSVFHYFRKSINEALS